MLININGLKVYFPYNHVYPEQYSYMSDLSSVLVSQSHALLEMPCGTGKTISLLSLIISYQLSNKNVGKLIYCTRTTTEMVQVFKELGKLNRYLDSVFGNEKNPVLAVAVSSRKNLCVNDGIEKSMSRNDVIDSDCRNRTVNWVTEKFIKDGGNKKDIVDIESCHEFVNLERMKLNNQHNNLLRNGVHSIEDLKMFGLKNGICPYFLARETAKNANVIVLNYAYLIDPKVSSLFSFENNSIVVFDEAHNIDNICIQALSLNIDTFTLKNAVKNIKQLKKELDEKSDVNKQRLLNEYNNLVENDDVSDLVLGENYHDQISTHPIFKKDLAKKAIPGSIRRGIHFLNFLRRLIHYLHSIIKVQDTVQTFPQTVIDNMKKEIFLEKDTLLFCTQRMISLLNTLQLMDIHNYLPLRTICDFATLLGTYQQGFSIIIEPYDDRTPDIYDPKLQFICLDSRIAMEQVFKSFKTVVITSGTLSPLEVYPKLLGFQPVLSKSYDITLVRTCICPLIISKGNDQKDLSTSFKLRGNTGIIINYGEILVEVSTYVPDGVVCFFPSYQYLEDIYTIWYEERIINSVLKNKLVFLETPNTNITSIALTNFRKTVDSGRGAVFLCVARGKVSEGIDFDGQYGRAVIMFGVPFLNTTSKKLNARLNFVKRNMNIDKSDFLTFDAIRNTSQCICRIIRNKTDYGIMILADKRYNSKNRRKMLPNWIKTHLIDENMNLSTGTAIGILRQFLLQMAQNWNEKNILGKLLLNEDDIEKKERKRKGGHYVKDERKIKKIKVVVRTQS